MRWLRTRSWRDRRRSCSSAMYIKADERAPSIAAILAERSVLDERLEPLAARRMPQLAQRLRFDLPDPLARHLEVLTDLFERVIRLLADAEPHAQHLLLARRQGGEHLAGLVREVHRDHALARR